MSIKKFLNGFFNYDEEVCFRIFSDRKDTNFKGKKYTIKLSNVGKILSKLKEHNINYRGIFFVVNHGGHEDKDIKRINAQFVESDSLPIEEQMKRIKAFPLEPSIIVQTRKSLHVYYLIKNGSISDFRRIQIKLAIFFNGDRNCINESRVLRLPGFYHCKKEPIMVKCIKFNPEIKYTQEEIEKYLPKEEYKKNISSLVMKNYKPCQKGLQMVCDKCLFLKHCKTNSQTLSEHDWYAMISNLAVFEGGIEKIHEYSRAYQGYSKEETDKKIEHFITSKTGPIKCSTIAEKGFKCPLSFDGCKCLSPASLSFKALDTEEIMEKVEKLPTAGDLPSDMKTAMKFINSWLYNVEPAIAEIIIGENIREHFSLKNIKGLKDYFRKVNKEFKKTSIGRGKHFNIPAWYVVNESGYKFMPGILAEYLKENVKAFYTAESFYIYENGVYNDISDDEASNIVRNNMIKECCTMSSIIDARDQWKITILKALNNINCNPYIINLKNGLYDVASGKIKEHSHKFYSTIQLNTSYNPSAKCGRFIEFLKEVLEPELIPLIQEIMGYLLIPATKAQKSFVFVGPPRTGKSTLLWVIENLILGAENVSNIPWQELGDRFKTAEIFGKLANVFADLPNRSIEDTGIFKVITGEDYLMGEKKNKDPFKFKPYARLVFSCNEIPKNYSDRTQAFYRRLIIIPFSKPVEADKVDAKLKDKLKEEADGIFIWALEGLKRLMDNNYNFSENHFTEREKRKYKNENNNVLCFIEECCTISNEAFCSRKELYERYKEYCLDNGLRSLSQIKFNNELETNYPEIKRTLDTISRRKCWQGITFSQYE
jgi:putative DNA primase/helicase